MCLCGPWHLKKLQTMAEITVLGAVNLPSTLYWGPRRPIFIFMRPVSSFFVKMWPSNEFELEIPALIQCTCTYHLVIEVIRKRGIQMWSKIASRFLLSQVYDIVIAAFSICLYAPRLDEVSMNQDWLISLLKCGHPNYGESQRTECTWKGPNSTKPIFYSPIFYEQIFLTYNYKLK